MTLVDWLILSAVLLFLFAAVPALAGPGDSLLGITLVQNKSGNALSVLFTVVVMDEILHHLLQQYGGAQTLGLTIFRWSCGLLLLLAILGAWSGSESGSDRVAATVFAFDRSMRLMEVGLFLLLMVLCRSLKHCWRQPTFGIALGFGVFASIELILVSLVMRYGNGQEAIVSLVKSTAYNAVTLVWIGYLRHQRHLVPRVEPVMSTAGPGFDLVTSTGVPHPDAGFMLRVEQAVDRVLSRSDWPRPAADGSRIVSRKPTPEERN